MEFYMEELCCQQHIPMNLVVHHNLQTRTLSTKSIARTV